MVEMSEDSLNRCFATFSDWNLKLTDCPIEEIYRDDEGEDVYTSALPKPEVQ